VKPNSEKNQIFQIENNKRINLLKHDEFMKQINLEDKKKKNSIPKESKSNYKSKNESDNQPELSIQFTDTNSYKFYFNHIFNASHCTKDIFNYYEKTNKKKRIKNKFIVKNFFLLGDKNIKKNVFTFGKSYNSIKIKGMVEEYIEHYKHEEGLGSLLNLSSNRTINKQEKSHDSFKFSNWHKRNSTNHGTLGEGISIKTSSYMEKKSQLKIKRTGTLNNINSSEITDSESNESSLSDLKKYLDLFQVKCVKYVKEKRFIMDKKFKFVPIDRFFNNKNYPEDFEGGSKKVHFIVSPLIEVRSSLHQVKQHSRRKEVDKEVNRNGGR
jgi:hypothetical protein